MSTRQHGYATTAVATVFFGLSITATAVLNLASTGADKGQKIVDRIILDAALEGVFHQTVADLINGEHQLTSGTLSLSGQVEAGAVAVRITDERTKIDINRAPTKKIDVALGIAVSDRPTRSAMRAEIRQRRAEGKLFQSLSELIESDARSFEPHCLSETFTAFYTNPISISRSAQAASLDGRVLRIQVETAAADLSSRGLDGIVLITGDRTDPAWLMDWRRYTTPEMETCSR